MNSRHLKIFTVVYEKLNMTQAAESLFISQPSVSQVIRELEDYYGAKLFERYPRKLYPTPEGDVLYDYARQILGLCDEAKNEILTLGDRVTITVGANISAGTVLMEDYIDEFHEKYPGARVKVEVAGSSKLSEMLYNNEMDFAVMEDLVYDSKLVQEPYYQDRIVFVCAPENKLAEMSDLSIEDLAGEEFLLRSRGVGVRDKFDYLMNLHDMNTDPLWESTNTRALINAASADYGIAVLPYLLVRKSIDDGIVAELDIRDDSLLRNLNITYHKDKIFNKWTKYFIEIIKNSQTIQ